MQYPPNETRHPGSPRELCRLVSSWPTICAATYRAATINARICSCSGRTSRSESCIQKGGNQVVGGSQYYLELPPCVRIPPKILLAFKTSQLLLFFARILEKERKERRVAVNRSFTVGSSKTPTLLSSTIRSQFVRIFSQHTFPAPLILN